MKLACLCLTICLCAFLKAFSQSVTLPKLSKYADTTPSYYLSLYDEYLELFDEYSYYKSSNPDSFKIDFSKYDLKGIKAMVNGNGCLFLQKNITILIVIF